MKWTGEQIRKLRLRLGWSQADLARRIGCRQQTVSEWETDVYQPQNAYSRLLDMMLAHVEEYSNQTSHRVAAENLMKTMGLTQIATAQVIPKAPSEFDPQID